MKHLYLFRHANSLTNAGEYWPDGPQTIPLSRDGEMQAARFAQDWQIRPDILVSSPYTRSVQTLAPLTRKFNVQTITLPVQEFTYWNLRMSPAEYQGRHDAVKMYWEQLDTHAKAGMGAESFEEFLLRILTFRNWATVTPYQVCMCCSHGFYMHGFRLLFALLKGVKPAAVVQLASRELMQHLRDTLPESSYENLAVEHYSIESPD